MCGKLHGEERACVGVEGTRLLQDAFRLSPTGRCYCTFLDGRQRGPRRETGVVHPAARAPRLRQLLSSRRRARRRSPRAYCLRFRHHRPKVRVLGEWRGGGRPP
jgi:hypothetical protein